MPPLTQEAVRKVIGPVDESLVADLVATGATQEELAEAYAWSVSDEALLNEGRALPSGRVGQLVDLLTSADEDEPQL